MKAKCIYCKNKEGKLPRSMPLYCSRFCMEQQIVEQHMDWVVCPRCNQWYDQRYICPNCPDDEDVLSNLGVKDD